MRRLFAGGTCMAVTLTFGMVVFAQSTPTPTQQPAPTPAQPAAQATEQVTVVGCVQREADYRRARDAGRGGVAGTGAGVGNEFVLVSASISTGTTAAAGTPPSAAGTTGTIAGSAYELTGKNESQVEQYVGKRVEIMGKLKAAETSATGPTGGATASVPLSKDLKLRELEVASVKETTGTCPAAK